MSTCEPVDKTRGEQRGQSSAAIEAERSLEGDAFPDSLTLPEYTSAERSTTHPLGELGSSQSTPPVATRSISRNPTPRPHLFQSLEAARDHVYRKSSDTRQACRNASGEVSPTSSEDEPTLGDMNLPPSTRAFGRPLTGHAQSQCPALPEFPTPPRGFTPIAKPIIWENVPKPLNTSSSHNVSSSQMSGSSVDNIIGQYGQQSSSAAQSQAAVYGGSSSTAEVDRFNGQVQHEVQENAGTQPFFEDSASTDLGGGGTRLKSKVFDESAPLASHASRSPLHPSNPFYSGPIPDFENRDPPELWSSLCPAGPDALLRETPTPPVGHTRAKLGSDPSAESVPGSETVSLAESKVGPLNRPSNAMHSVRRQQRARQSSASYSTQSVGAASEVTDASDTDEDPFKYDRRGPFLHPSKERVVSMNLQKVGGLARESTATVYSQDGTPSKTFYGDAATDYFDTKGQPISPGSHRPQRGNSTLQAPLRNPFVRVQPGHHNPANVSKDFYDPDAINLDWTSGNPDMVRVPVTKKGNLFGGTQRSPGVEPGTQRKQDVGLEALRRHEGDKRITGNTED